MIGSPLIRTDGQYRHKVDTSCSQEAKQAAMQARPKEAPLSLWEFVQKVAPEKDWPKLEGRSEADLLDAIKVYIARREGCDESGEQELAACGNAWRTLLADDHASDGDIKSLAKRCAGAMAVVLLTYSPWEIVEAVYEALRIPFLHVGMRGVTTESLGHRLRDEKTWRRHFRKAHAQAVEHRLTDAGRVMRGREPVVSGLSRAKGRERWRRSREAIEAAQIVSACGETLDLATAVDASVSNPRNRLAELVIRGRGMEAAAQEAGDAAVFLTITNPSRYHPSRSRFLKTDQGRKYYSEPNPNWLAGGKPTPREGNAALLKVFGKLRCVIKNRNWPIYGLRVVEPHADGSPHWHMLVFGPRPLLEAFVTEYETRACKEDAAELEGMTSVQDENGHWKRVPVRQARFKAVWLDNVAADGEGNRYGGPLAYILKYLAKNLTGRKNDGGEIGQDFEIGKGAVEGAELVRIWASLWGIRQFQAFGDASVSVWREARRLRDTPPKDQVLMAVCWAATVNDWHAYRELSKQVYFHLVREAAQGCNRFGEWRGEVVKGFGHEFADATTRTKTWTIDWRAGQRKAAEAQRSAAAQDWLHGHNRPSRQEFVRGVEEEWAMVGLRPVEGQRPDLGFISITVRDEIQADGRPTIFTKEWPCVTDSRPPSMPPPISVIERSKKRRIRARVLAVPPPSRAYKASHV
ncbi:replication endonuclease [Chitinimonas arctica]|uniref:Replication endonuclease n=1 Tax=Chitinimonas arctica TaxID=2594795 RepID=A0A516SI05_9NEIS|nr:replication endonuclease [Chitinimonas arctica]QDQ27678.1 replication endonuclease [Chitinimonas arctica]